MTLYLQLVKVNEIEEVRQLQMKGFQSLYLKYQDKSTNPACESFSRILEKYHQKETTYFFIVYQQEKIGSLRLVQGNQGKSAKISPISILPSYQNQGI